MPAVKTEAQMFVGHKNFWEKRAAAPGRYHPQQRERIEAILKERLGNACFDNGMDFGCGEGRLEKFMSDRCRHVWAVDIVDAQIKRAEAVSPVVSGLLVSHPPGLPFPKPHIDFMLGCLVFQHIVSDAMLADTMKALRACLKRGSRVIVIDNAVDREFHVIPRNPEVLAKMLDLASGWAAQKITINDRPEDHWLLDGTRA